MSTEKLSMKMTEKKESILAQSKKSKFSVKKVLMLIIILGGIGGAVYWYLGKDEATVIAAEPEVFELKKTDLESVISSDGNIMNPNMANLSFLINGTLEEVFVIEGDKVEKGQVLAKLDTRDLLFDLRSAQNDVAISNANIISKRADLTDTDLILAENDLVKTKENNDSTTREQSQKVQQTFDSAVVEIEKALPEIKDILKEVDYILGIDRYYTGKTISDRAFNDTLNEKKAENAYKDLWRDLGTLSDNYYARKSKIEKSEISQTIWKISNELKSVETLIETVTELFDTAHASAAITESTIASNLSTVQGLSSKVYGLASTMSKTKQSIDSALLLRDNSMIDINNSLITTQLKLENSKKQTEKSKINKENSLNILYTQLQNTQLKIEKAQYNLSLATLTSPMNGEVIQVNGSVGETIKADSTSSDSSLIRILSDTNFTTEVYVEEIDIAKVEKGQKVKITLDAIENIELEGSVTFISAIATTDNNGVVTYLVEIDITDTQDTPIREGMTTYVDFVLGSATDVLAVPVKAIERERFVIMEDSSRRPVKTGFSDGSMIEITDGLEVGEKILIGATTSTNRTGEGAGQREMSDERKASMKEAGFTDEEIQTLSDGGEMTDAMREKMQTFREASGSTEGVGRGLGGGGGDGPPR